MGDKSDRKGFTLSPVNKAKQATAMPGSSMYDLVKQLKAQKEQQNALSGGAGSTALVISPQEFAGSARGVGAPKPNASPSQLTQADRKESTRLVNTVVTRT